MAYFKISEFPQHLHLEFFAPQSANALSLEAVRELSKIRKQYSKWNRPVVVSSAHASMFCSGGNLSDYKKLKTKAAGLKINREIGRSLQAFGEWPVVKLALIEGDVLGGGMEWLAHFDFRWCTPQVLFGFWQRRIGLSSGWGGGRAWSAKIGEENVRKLLLEARVLGAESALAHGLVERILSPWRLRESVIDWVSRFPANESTAKTVRWNGAGEAKTFAALWLGPEHKTVLQKWKG